MQPRSPRKVEDDRRLAERAAEWLGIMQSPTPAERGEFAEWLTASPRHAEEFLFVTALHEQLGHTPIENFEPVRAALARASANVVPLSMQPAEDLAPFTTVNSPERRVPRRHWRLGIAAALACVTLGAATLTWWMSQRGPTYATAIGEQRTIRLDDGSSVELNTDSRVRVSFSAGAREVRLLQGEALFSIQRDPRRPFRVLTDTAVVQAVGTQFNVYRQDGGATTVSVVEGRVRVTPLDSKQKSPAPADTALDAGEEARIDPDGAMKRQRSPEGVAHSVAWREQRLVFLSDTLKNVAAEFNRYNRHPHILIQDENAGARRYSGVFNSNDPQSLIQFLREDAELELLERDGELLIRAR